MAFSASGINLQPSSFRVHNLGTFWKLLTIGGVTWCMKDVSSAVRAQVMPKWYNNMTTGQQYERTISNRLGTSFSMDETPTSVIFWHWDRPSTCNGESKFSHKRSFVLLSNTFFVNYQKYIFWYKWLVQTTHLQSSEPNSVRSSRKYYHSVSDEGDVRLLVTCKSTKMTNYHDHEYLTCSDLLHSFSRLPRASSSIPIHPATVNSWRLGSFMMAGKLSFVICNTRYVSILLLLLQHDMISWSVGTRHKAARETRVGY